MGSKHNAYFGKTPDYEFRIKDGMAIGILPDGSEFIIDATKIKIVEQFYFHLNHKGYAYSVRSKEDGGNLMLHWLVLGYTSRPPFIVDHLNRNKLDCWVSNLRLVTNQQNSMNRRIGKNNRSGYLGVVVRKRDYLAKICLSNHQISLLKSTNPVLCASAYNYASSLLFGEFAGHRNEVPELDEFNKVIVRNACIPYMKLSMNVRKPIFKEVTA